jgi:hypothetical protein
MPLANTALQVAVRCDLSSALDLTTAQASLNIQRGQAFDAGTGAGQVDRVFSDTRTLTASSSEDLDLAGALTDALGGTTVFARIKAILVAAAAGNTNNVIVGGVANAWATLLSPAATGLITLRPGAGFAAWCGGADATGFAITAGTGDLLHVANSAAGTSVTYDVVVIGCSA